MTQYLLSIYQPDGDPPPPEVLDADHGRPRRRSTQRCEAAGAWVFTGGLHPPEHGDRACAPQDGEVLMTDGPFTEGKEHLGGFTDHRRARPRRGARLGPRGSRAATGAADRGPAVPGRVRGLTAAVAAVGAERSSASSARSTAARSPSWSASSATSTSPRRRSRTRSPRPCERWPRDGLPPSPAGWIITTARNRAIDRLRREASRADRHAAGRAACTPATSRPRRTGPCATTGCA